MKTKKKKRQKEKHINNKIQKDYNQFKYPPITNQFNKVAIPTEHCNIELKMNIYSACYIEYFY